MPTRKFLKTRTVFLSLAFAMVAMSAALLLLERHPRINTRSFPEAWMPFDFGETSLGVSQRKKHFALALQAKIANPKVYFLGDSITENWTQKSYGEKAWQKYFAPLNSFNGGIGGSTTQTELWRINNGELDGIHPRLLVIMIGSNNLVVDSPANTIAGVKAVVSLARKKLPETKILLLSVLPRTSAIGDRALKEQRILHNISTSNNLLAAQCSNEVFYLDIQYLLRRADGSIDDELVPGGVHPSKKGYERIGPIILKDINNVLSK